MDSSKKNLRQWMDELGLSPAELAESASLDPKVVEAIAASRYTTSPVQRQRIAAAIGVSPDDIQFGQTVAVDHMYGHGPQFGRSP